MPVTGAVAEKDLAVGLVSGPDDTDDGKGDLERGNKSKKRRPLDVDVSGTAAGGDLPESPAADRWRRVWPWAAGVGGGLIGLITLFFIITHMNKPDQQPQVLQKLTEGGLQIRKQERGGTHAAVISTTLILEDGDFTAEIFEQKGKPVHVTFSKATAHGQQDLTWAAAITALRSEPDFRALLSDTLAKMPFQAFYWECPAVSEDTKAQKAFEFVVMDAPGLVGTQANPASFSEHIGKFQGVQAVTNFPNLDGDCELVVPSQATGVDQQTYGHLAKFVRGAPRDQQQEAFRMLGVHVHERMLERKRKTGPSTPIWVSTHGHSVPWLHLGVCDAPMHYHYGPYKVANYDPPAAN